MRQRRKNQLPATVPMQEFWILYLWLQKLVGENKYSTNFYFFYTVSPLAVLFRVRCHSPTNSKEKFVSPSNQNLINTKNMRGCCRSTLKQGNRIITVSILLRFAVPLFGGQPYIPILTLNVFFLLVVNV